MGGLIVDVPGSAAARNETGRTQFVQRVRRICWPSKRANGESFLQEME